MNISRPARLLCSIGVLVAAGCAGSVPPGITVAGGPVDNETAPKPAPAAYQLSAEEQALDCKKLTGRMQVRILQERDHAYRRQTSSTSQELQAATNSLFGEAKRGADPDADHSKAVAQLEAYNGRLKEKGCKTFDLAKELEPKPVTVTPTPVAPPDKSMPGKPN